MPAATAAPDPPEEPPVVRVVSQGFLEGPNLLGSVVGRIANSGALVLPHTTNPART